MTDWVTFFAILGGGLAHVVFFLALCYCLCRRRKCCPCCFKAGSVETDSECESPVNTMMLSARDGGAVRLSIVTTESGDHRSEVADNTESDPGIEHINRFLGRSSSVGQRSVFDDESDKGVVHIRRALGLFTNDPDQDRGLVHVRRALGMEGRSQRLSTASEPDFREGTSGVQTVQTSHSIDAASDAIVAGLVAETFNLSASAADEEERVCDRSDGNSDGCDHVATIDRLPSYQEALDILAAMTPEEPPPRYEDVFNV